MSSRKTLSPAERNELLQTVQDRFERHRERHADIPWARVHARLEARPEALWPLREMERTGGEPDVVAEDAKTGECLFVDCSAQSPAGRRSLCYDNLALQARKEHKPKGSATEAASAMGITLLTEGDYRHLQTIGAFDTTTSSWIVTPPAVRKLGGALFCDRRFDTVFTYHNSAESYYAARGFRGLLRV